MGKKVTMQTIADHLNISKNSVSQALSGKPGVSDATRRKIFDAANLMGYVYKGQRSEKAQTGAVKNVALIASEFAFSLKSFFGEIYLSIERELSKKNINLYIQSVDEQMKNNLTMPALLDKHEIDGLIILSHISGAYTEKLLDLNLPAVVIDHHYPGMPADAILTNNRFSSYEAVSHMIGLGHQNIAYVGNIRFSPSYYERLEGFRLAHYNAGIKLREDLLFTALEENEESIGEIVKQAMATAEVPTAWFCINDGFGFYVNSCLQRNSVRVPEDASVCSFDNGQLSQISTPKLTTVDIDLDYYGQKAVEQLLWRADHRKAPYQEILLPARLIKRPSTAAPKAHSIS